MKIETITKPTMKFVDLNVGEEFYLPYVTTLWMKVRGVADIVWANTSNDDVQPNTVRLENGMIYKTHPDATVIPVCGTYRVEKVG